MDVFESYRKFCRAVTTGRFGSISPVCRYVLTILSGMILYKCDESSSTVAHIHAKSEGILTDKD